MNRDITPLLNPNHKEFFRNTSPLLVFFGGAGAGKSYSTADKLLLQPLIYQKPIKMLVLRKSLPSLKRTCLDILLRRAETFGISINLNKVDLKIQLPYSSEILMLSVDNPSELPKIKSITDADIAWIEEANELSEDVLDQVLLRLRGGNLEYKQCILTFNPTSTTSWVYRRFFERDANNCTKIKVTYKDNPWCDEKYSDSLESLKEVNDNLYRVYALGEWGTLEASILKNYTVVDKVTTHNDIIIGIDFGYNNPTAVVKIYLTDNPREIYAEELLYQSNLTNTDLIDMLKQLNIQEHLLYCDSAEPARIADLRRAGFRVREANKDVKAGINYLQSVKINIIDGSDNLKKEIQSYQWAKDKNGSYIDQPVKFRDHLIDAMRYAVYTHTRQTMVAEGVGADGKSISNILTNLMYQQQLGII